MKTEDLSQERREYGKHELNESNLSADPLEVFREWIDYAMHHEADHTAMVLSTVSDNKPSSRVVLLKGIRQGKYVFYTNYDSKKGKELSENPNVALNFFWPHAERQIRISGTASKMAREESETYFDSRPIESRIAAIVSKQSSKIKSRIELEEAFEKFVLSEEPPKTPNNWGGFEVDPIAIEFWQGRVGRLHDRILYSKTDLGWERSRLSP